MHPPDDRSPMAQAMSWASSIMTVAIEMVAPGLVGYWLDRRLGSVPWLMLLGFGLGGTLAMVHLIQMTKSARRKGGRGKDSGQEGNRDA